MAKITLKNKVVFYRIRISCPNNQLTTGKSLWAIKSTIPRKCTCKGKQCLRIYPANRDNYFGLKKRCYFVAPTLGGLGPCWNGVGSCYIHKDTAKLAAKENKLKDYKIVKSTFRYVCMHTTTTQVFKKVLKHYRENPTTIVEEITREEYRHAIKTPVFD